MLDKFIMYIPLLSVEVWVLVMLTVDVSVA